MRLKGKIALIAGAGPGMGRATAILFAQEGAQVGVIARDPAKGDETAGRIAAAGGEALGLAGDLAVRGEAETAVKTVVEHWGGLDILYYGAGGFFRADMNLAERQARQTTGQQIWIAVQNNRQRTVSHLNWFG